jgi:hypothetical protein
MLRDLLLYVRMLNFATHSPGDHKRRMSGQLSQKPVAARPGSEATRVGARRFAGPDLCRDATPAEALDTGNPTMIAFALFAQGEALADNDAGCTAPALDDARQRAEDVGSPFVAGVALSAAVALRGPPRPRRSRHWRYSATPSSTGCPEETRHSW